MRPGPVFGHRTEKSHSPELVRSYNQAMNARNRIEFPGASEIQRQDHFLLDLILTRKTPLQQRPFQVCIKPPAALLCLQVSSHIPSSIPIFWTAFLPFGTPKSTDWSPLFCTPCLSAVPLLPSTCNATTQPPIRKLLLPACRWRIIGSTPSSACALMHRICRGARLMPGRFFFFFLLTGQAGVLATLQ